MRRRTMVLVGVIGALALAVSACAADPTTSTEYSDLQTELETALREREALAADLEEADESLASAVEEKQTAIAAAQAARDDSAAVIERRNQLERSLIAAATSLDSAFNLTALDVANWLSCADPEMIEGLSGDVIELREQLAATADWFDTAAEYDLCESQRAFVNSDNAVTRQNDTALTEVWDRYWSTEFGSQEEAFTYYEFSLRRLLTTLEEIGNARSIVEDAIPAGYENAEEA